MTPETDISILEGSELSLVQASTGKRFANLIIDIIVFYILAFAVGILWAVISPETIQSYANDEAKSAGTLLSENLLSIVVYVLYFFALEALFKGKTIGKMVTGTRAVNDHDGSQISTQTALTRALSRIVPFEPFSAFGGYPWHDKWTNTYVIDEKQSVRLSQ